LKRDRVTRIPLDDGATARPVIVLRDDSAETLRRLRLALALRDLHKGLRVELKGEVLSLEYQAD
jgi:hypothetical protein